jgi:hypothetical protein
VTLALAFHHPGGAELDEGLGAAGSLANFGGLHLLDGRPDEAIRYLGAAVNRYRACGDRHGAARHLMNLGELHTRQGNHDGCLPDGLTGLSTSLSTVRLYSPTLVGNRRVTGPGLCCGRRDAARTSNERS